MYIFASPGLAPCRRSQLSSNVKFHLAAKYFVNAVKYAQVRRTKAQAEPQESRADFVGCDAIWGHFTVTREDKRQDYGEERLVCFGLLKSEVVVMV